MGRHCELTGFLTSSTTGKPTPSCQYSKFTYQGYSRLKRFRGLTALFAVTAVDATQWHAANLTDFYNYGYAYYEPAENVSTSLNVRTEQSTYINMQCFQKHCKVCDANGPTTCQLCWGRFGDPDTANLCKQATTCASIADKYKANCYTHGAACAACEVCNLGYALKPTE